MFAARLVGIARRVTTARPTTNVPGAAAAVVVVVVIAAVEEAAAAAVVAVPQPAMLVKSSAIPTTACPRAQSAAETGSEDIAL